MAKNPAREVAEQREPLPFVTVMLPCFNSAPTISTALASLLAQSYPNWRCIIVDDGSTDELGDVLSRYSDPRFQVVALRENRGRAIARQIALDLAVGDYICMLDADDWMYPERLEVQVNYLEHHPHIALVSLGMAIVDRDGGLCAVRGSSGGDESVVFRPDQYRLGVPAIAHAPSMIRREVAKRYRYDPDFDLAEDADFLMQVLMDHAYALLPNVAYAYAEHQSASKQKVLRSIALSRRSFRKHLRRFPMQASKQIILMWLKEMAYRFLFAFGREKAMLTRRSNPATPKDYVDFLAAKSAVMAAKRDS